MLVVCPATHYLQMQMQQIRPESIFVISSARVAGEVRRDDGPEANVR